MKKRRNTADAQARIVTAIFLIAFYYVSFRYPFKIGDPLTSPTYAPTPVWLQVAKVALLGLLLPIGLANLRKDMRFSTLELTIASFGVIACLYCAVIGLSDLAIATSMFDVGFIMIFALLFANPAHFALNAERFVTMLTVFFWLNIAAFAIQFALFWFFDRLPSLAWGGLVTRFGGIWDDPNSSLAPFALFVPYYITRYGLNRRAGILIGLTLVSIVLAQSVTSLIAIILTVPALMLFFRKQWPGATQTKVMLTVGAASVAVVFAFMLVYFSDVIDARAIMRNLETTIEIKANSAAMRSDSYAFLSATSLGTVLGVAPLLDTGENGFVNIFANFGLPMLLAFVAIQCLTIHCLYVWTRRANTRPSYALAVGCSCYFVWYSVSMFNIPQAQVFPLNLLAAVVAGMAIAAKKTLTRSAVKRRYATGYYRGSTLIG